MRKKGVLLLAGNFGGVVHEEYVIAELVDVRLMSIVDVVACVVVKIVKKLTM